MMPPPFPHKHYLRFVLNKAGRYGGLRTDHRHFRVWRKLKATDLDAAYRIRIHVARSRHIIRVELSRVLYIVLVFGI